MSSDHSKQDARLRVVKKEILTMSEEIPHTRLVPSYEAAEEEEDGIHYLSGKPFFDVILAKSHLPPQCQLCISAKILPLLPRSTVPVVLSHGGKDWNLSYIGGVRWPRFDARWKTFVTENHLEIGDACVFELMENSSTSLRFKVHILRYYLPPELLAVIDSRGKTKETAIQLD